MDNNHLGKCLYCGFDIQYSGNNSVIKCKACGKALKIADFEQERVRFELERQRAEQAEKEIETARQEKRQAEERLHRTLSLLGDISLAQSKQKKELQEVLRRQNAGKNELQAVTSLLEAIRGSQGTQHDALSELLSAVLSGQETASEKIEALHAVSDKLLGSQKDILGLASLLRTDTLETNRLIGQLFSWAGNTNQENVRRLKALQSGSEFLQSGLRDLDRKIDRLDEGLQGIRDQLSGFEKRWESARLEKLSGLFHQAENLQLDRRFDDAEPLYRQVLSGGGKDPEVYWRLILCHYCVEYQEADQHKWVPTVLYPALDLPRGLSDWKELQGACGGSKELLDHYAGKLQEIEDIIVRYIQLRQTVQDQVFICTKQKADGHWTTESDAGSVLYDIVRNHGYSVFNSRRSRLPAGESFEPYIIAALLSARLMIVVGTSPESMNARWVRNEWTRFQWLQEREINQTGRTNRKLVCYLKGMDPARIPPELHPDYQAILEDADVTDKIHDLLNRTFGKPSPIPTPVPPVPPPPPSPVPFETVQIRLEAWLAEEKFEKVSDEYDSFLEASLYVDEPRLYLYKLCAIRKACDPEELARQAFSLKDNRFFKLAEKVSRRQKKDAELLAELIRLNHPASRPVQPERPVVPEKPVRPEKREEQKKPLGSKKAPVQETPTVPVIASLELDEIDARLTRYMQKYNLKPQWLHMPDFPVSSVFLSDFISRLILNITYRQPLYSDQAVITWQIFTEKGQAFTSQIRETHPVPPGGISSTMCFWPYSQKQSWPEGTYSVYVTVNGSAPMVGQFHVISLDSLKTGSKSSRPVEKETKSAPESAGRKDDKVALFSLGYEYQYGQGRKLDYVKAVECYRKSAELGYAPAQNNLGWMYENGLGIRQDDGEACKWYRMSADQRHANAQNNLGCMYENGRGVRQDFSEAYKWYRKAADQNFADAQNNVGRCFANGWGVRQDYFESCKWYRKAADQNEKFAQNNLGWLYENGRGTRQDYSEAYQWYRKSADQNHADAQNNVGRCFQNGWGVKQDDAEACKWYRRAADQNEKFAQNNLGWLYENGRGVKKDYTEAYQWYRKAADQKLAEAQNNIGRCFLGGWGVRQNDAEAFKWFRKAADQNEKYAQNNLGWMYENGRGVKQDYSEACKWYRKSADQKLAAAQNNVGRCFVKGWGVKKDYGEAAKWYLKSAEQNDPNGEFNLASLYENGLGVPKNLETAKMYYQRSAQHGYHGALEKYQSLTKAK